jgi:hypothetical protein
MLPTTTAIQAARPRLLVVLGFAAISSADEGIRSLLSRVNGYVEDGHYAFSLYLGRR